MRLSSRVLPAALILACSVPVARSAEVDPIRDLQAEAMKNGASPVAHWGSNPKVYTAWSTHTNRLIPVYTYGTRGAGPGVDLDSYTGPNSAYRTESALRRIYGKVPQQTLNPSAEYLDQTDLAALQRAAFASGKKHVILFVFDGMDWQTTRAAAIYNARRLAYDAGRGTGTHFQEYQAGGTTQYGYMVTSPHNEGTRTDVNAQSVVNSGGKVPGGYDVARGGPNPWTPGNDPEYLINQRTHAYADSSSTAAAMTTGVKTFNNAVNVDPSGVQVPTIAAEVQALGLSAGAVSSVPISHATPACAYAHNVDRDDYQDLTRDMLGLPSIAHPDRPLPGLEVVIGGGHGTSRKLDAGQGKNFVPGNVYLTDADLMAANVANGGKYVVAQRTAGVKGAAGLHAAAQQAASSGRRLLGFYGVGKYNGHLPFQTADGDYQPAPGRTLLAEVYSAADREENPTLADMTSAALAVLSTNPKGFWLMVEAGDVDWANHDNNLDNSIGAVNSGDAAVKVVTDWVEQHSNWQDSLLIVTADHGHYLVIDRPELLTGK